ncbi:DUF1028 domain-containing protein [Caldinitratiruptor microaerophilus]|uniref:Putative peptidoglycan binding domain-containing protein n=1 Tax=Caldinitratiruptor microaerophilus TaxID=671077 RepID=A0AA35CK92_9FIRM|nr:DUF1028 domain-containing protein [Caldinitratiruptor microaerophilus]BDG60667.1 hypothetical protein caldi_17570 [Caldinitratiruptor microaerophilus]
MRSTHADPPVATFSIVARDPVAGEWGVAVQSRFLAVGAVVPWARAGVGAIATQSFANTTYGPKGLELLAGGLSAQEVLDRLVAEDPDRDLRQVGIVDAQGRAASFTGAKCMPWAGSVTGDGFACQGNILAGPRVVEAMAETFLSTAGPLSVRLLEALKAGQREGGDTRGKQSAALLVVKEKGGYGGFNDRLIDLRVDDHPDPFAELERLLGLWRLYFEKADPETAVVLDDALWNEIAGHLARLGFLDTAAAGREEVRQALERWIGRENFEERDLTAMGRIDPQVLDILRRQAG